MVFPKLLARYGVPSIFAGHYDPSFTLDLCCKELGMIQSLSAGPNPRSTSRMPLCHHLVLKPRTDARGVGVGLVS
jgi:hypothetical protein